MSQPAHPTTDVREKTTVVFQIYEDGDGYTATEAGHENTEKAGGETPATAIKNYCERLLE